MHGNTTLYLELSFMVGQNIRLCLWQHISLTELNITLRFHSVPILSLINTLKGYDIAVLKLTPRSRVLPENLTGPQRASEDVPRILWNPKFHGRIYKCPLPVSILSQNNALHASPSTFLKFYFNIILQLSLGLPNGFFPSGLPTKILYTPFLSP